MSSTEDGIADIGIQLYHAASAGRTELINGEARCRFHGNSKFGDLQETPLHAAIRSGHLAAAKRLLQLGVREDLVDSEGNLPLHLSASRCQAEFIHLFCKSVISPKIINTVNKEGHTPLFCALNNADYDARYIVDCVKALLACGADVNTPGKCGQLPIEKAMKVGDNDACALFIFLAPKTKSRDIVINAFELLAKEARLYRSYNYADVIHTALSAFPNVWDMYAVVEKEKKCKCTLSKAEQEASSFLEAVFVFAAFDAVDKRSVLDTIAHFGNDAAFLYELENMDDEERLTINHVDYTYVNAMKNANIRDSSICLFLQKMTAKFSLKQFDYSNTLYNAIDTKRQEVVDHLIHSFPALLKIAYFEEADLCNYIKLGTSTTILKKMFDACNKDSLYKWLERLAEKTLVELCLKNATELQVPFLSECLQFDRERFIKSLVVPYVCSGSKCEKTGSELHTAVKNGRLDLCEFFISTKPALANMADYKGMLPLSYAIEGQSNEMVLMLLQHTPDPNGFASSAVLDICGALNHGRLSRETIEQLLSKGLRCCDGESAGKYPSKDNPWLGKWCTGYRQEEEQPSVVLHEAAAAGNNTELQRLATEGGIDWYLVDSMHRTVLHYAIENYAISLESIRMLVENGALVNRVGGRARNTPLHMALDYDRMDVCKYLLTRGAEPCIADTYCDSAIHGAIHYGLWDTVKMMLTTARDLGKCNAEGSSLLTELIRYLCVPDLCVPFDLIENLVGLGADVNFHSSQYNRQYPTQLIMPNVDTWPGLLHIAVRLKDVKLVKLLCNEKVTHHAEFSSIHVLVSLQDTEFAEEVIPSLLRNGEDINEREMIMEKTPLEVAADLGSVSMLQLLIDHGAKLDIPLQTTLSQILFGDKCCPEVLLSLMQAGIDINAECINAYDCECIQDGFHSGFICNLLNIPFGTINGYKVVCKLAIHFSLAIKDVRLESEEFQAAVGASVQSALLAMNQGPQSLAVQCRDFIRRQCRPRDGCVPYRSLGAALDAIPVPHIIKSFLKMQDVDLDDIRAALMKDGVLEEEVEPCQSYIDVYTREMYPLQLIDHHLQSHQ